MSLVPLESLALRGSGSAAPGNNFPDGRDKDFQNTRHLIEKKERIRGSATGGIQQDGRSAARRARLLGVLYKVGVTNIQHGLHKQMIPLLALATIEFPVLQKIGFYFL